jgi:Spy/CpxP family protein refolding chaperone
MTKKFLLMTMALAGAISLAQPALAESSASADAPGGEGISFPGQGGRGMAGHLPTSGYAYNDGSR